MGHPADLKRLTTQLKSTKELLVKLGKKKNLDQLLEEIKIKKGWTTPAEMAFALATIKSINAQIRQLDVAISDFEKAGRMVQS